MSKTVAEGGEPLPLADYDAIERAVMETSRGRWFLQEYARRQRQVDSQSLLSAMLRLQQAITRNQDELLNRLTRVLDEHPAPDSMAPVAATPVSRTAMKYFRADEDLFEPPAATAESARPRLIPRPAGEAIPDRSADIATEAPPVAGEPPRRRIVIIRHQPGDQIDVPLEREAESANG